MWHVAISQGLLGTTSKNHQLEKGNGGTQLVVICYGSPKENNTTASFKLEIRYDFHKGGT